MYTDQIISTTSYQIHSRFWNGMDLPPIIALHGWMDNAASFDILAPLLNKNCIIASDLPGHGLSPHISDNQQYHYVDFIGILYEIIQVLGLSKVILMGHSMGAGIVTLFAGSFPEIVEKLILIEGIGPVVSPAKMAPDNLKKSIRGFQKLRQQKNTVYQTKAKAIEVRKKAGNITSNAAVVLASRGLQKSRHGYNWVADKRLQNHSAIRYTEDQISYFLQNITAKTVLIQGEFSNLERIIPVKNRMCSIQNLQHHQIPGAHYLHMDNANLVANIINQFLL